LEFGAKQCANSRAAVPQEKKKVLKFGIRVVERIPLQPERGLHRGIANN